MRVQEQGTGVRDVALPEMSDPPAASALPEPPALEKARTDVVCSPAGTVKILFFSANTKDGDQLALDEECRAIG